MQNYKIIQVQKVESFLKEFFIMLGVPEEDSHFCSEALLSADLQGFDSHGMDLLRTYYDKVKEGVKFPNRKWQILKETETTATIDGRYGMGQIISHKAMDLAVKKARKSGLGAVAVRNSNHLGIAGYYTNIATKENMIGWVFSNAAPAIAPTYGVDPLLGTNPLAFGAPTNLGFPFIIDFAISIVRKNDIDRRAKRGEPMKEGWAIDQNGNSYTDGLKLRDDVKAGRASLLPFGAHRGYGLATLVEVLCASLQGGAYMQDLHKINQDGKPISHGFGHFFLAINIESFIDVNTFKNIITDIMRKLQSSRKIPGYDRIYIAGEKENETQKIRLENGIPVKMSTIKALREINNAKLSTRIDELIKT
ncbi:MAG: Ldh family oxidoreductase [Bacteroidetes bacterium]|nr:MAG: Ldh family oxidoreductase [Bacteroidota bacterium]